MSKEDIEMLLKAGCIREKKQRNVSYVKIRAKEVSVKEVQKLINEGRVISKDYGIIAVCKKSK